MGEEDRGSSGSSTAMIVVAVLGGLLLVGCCGGVMVVGGVFWTRTLAREAQMEVDLLNLEAQRSQMEVQKAHAEMREKLDSLKGPDVPALPISPESSPAPSDSPAPDSPPEEIK